MQKLVVINRADAPEPTYSTHDYTADNTTLIANPNRGFWVQEVNSTDLTALPTVPAGHYTVVRKAFRLDSWRTTATLPQQVLDDIQEFFDELRSRGQKVIGRFAYNYTNGGQDADIDIVLGHIAQLAPVINANADLIVAMEAGFAGPWAEMHHSSNNLVGGTDPAGYITDTDTAVNANTLAYVNRILDEWDVAYVLARLTRQADALIANSTSAHATPVDETSRFDGTRVARVGMYNDFFLNAPHDGLWVPWNNGPGSGDSPQDNIPVTGPRAAMYAFAAAHTAWTYMEGEPDPSQTANQWYSAARTIADLEAYHWDSVHSKVHPGSPTGDSGSPSVQEKWISDGIWEEIGRNLGYRIQLDSARLPNEIVPGQPFQAEFAFTNVGYSPPKHDRDFELHFVSTGSEPTQVVPIARTEIDVRHLNRGTHEIPVAGVAPAGMVGDYAMHLALPDPSARLAADPRYSIRLATQSLWDPATGRHDLGHTVTAA